MVYPENNMQRQIPYGIMNYAELIQESRYFIDKTHFIEKLEAIKTRFFSVREDLANPCSARGSSIIMTSVRPQGLKSSLEPLGLARARLHRITPS